MGGGTENSSLIGSVRAIQPGCALAGAVALGAWLIARGESALFGRAWIDQLVIAILLGAVVRSLWAPGGRFDAGITFSGKFLLEVAVALIGANISAREILTGGWLLLFGTATVVALSLAISYGVGRMFGLNRKLALLIAAGNSICGNSAIAAVAPVIEADARDVSAAIAFTAVLGVVVVLMLPFLNIVWWHLAPREFGVVAGLTVYAVPQVLAAAAPISSLSAQVGTFVKLIRVLMLGPLVLVLSLARHRRAGQGTRPSLSGLVPWFIIGFIVMMTLRSLGLLSAPVLAVTHGTAEVFTLIAMAALGLAVDIRDVAAAGPRVVATVTLSIVALCGLALGLVRLIG